ncbi:Catalase-peroxidase 2 [Dissostichus eleginoides]|uniref:Catalase-peroxidase 2 n=1 Tax=Dissostichus eleginoides TaxID=100907 RepID=A0AAD9BNT7_DISEL|nr:Catalase-peroxidase 2 [Dissostichus eleginoides]
MDIDMSGMRYVTGLGSRLSGPATAVSRNSRREMEKLSLKKPTEQTQHNSLYTSKQAPTKLSMPLCVTEE